MRFFAVKNTENYCVKAIKVIFEKHKRLPCTGSLYVLLFSCSERIILSSLQ